VGALGSAPPSPHPKFGIFQVVTTELLTLELDAQLFSVHIRACWISSPA